MANELSKEVMAREIHAKARSYYEVSEQYAYKFCMEVKRIRDERLFRELGYGNFGDYCESEFGLSRFAVGQRIQIAETFEDDSETMVSKFGHKKSLLFTQMPEEVRNDVLENGIPTDDGERKPAVDATRAEIAAYQKSLREAEANARKTEQQLADEKAARIKAEKSASENEQAAAASE